jgi:hypothetical protein
VPQARQVLVDAARGQRDHPAPRQALQLRLQITNLDHDHVGRVRLEAEPGEVLNHVVRAPPRAEYQLDPADREHRLIVPRGQYPSPYG